MSKDVIIMTAAALTGLVLWKGRDLRAALTMTGDGWNNLHPDMQQRAAAVLHDANAIFKPQGLSVGIFEGWRTLARQRDVMQRGNSFVTDPLHSYHVWGLACDFVFLDAFGQWTWQPFSESECAWYNPFCTDPNQTAWATLGDIIKRQGLAWGGDWKNYDGPHGELTHFGRPQNLVATYHDPAQFRAVWA